MSIILWMNKNWHHSEFYKKCHKSDFLSPNKTQSQIVVDIMSHFVLSECCTEGPWIVKKFFQKEICAVCNGAIWIKVCEPKNGL